MQIILGPMQGVLDAPVRELLTAINPYALCVTEFVRVVDAVLPPHYYYRLCPELKNGGKTAAGTPVRVQLLGQSPQYMAENAALAIELGSAGIDLNFGCPSKTVNNSLGGAALLKQPELIYQIVKSVRTAIPHAKLSAKIRLGFDDCSPFLEIAGAALNAGVDELVVHGRSKVDGYKKEAIRWDLIGEIQKRTAVSVVANGEIWCQEDAQNCHLQTGSSNLMVCRGALSMPNLATHIMLGAAPLAWRDVVALLLTYAKNFPQQEKKQYVSARIKQWLHYLMLNYPEASLLFLQIKNIHEQELIQTALQNYLQQETALVV